LQAGNKQDKLLARSRMGIYLGPSPSHASSVHLILSMQSGHVSPQFPVAFDDMFETIRESDKQPESHWQTRTRLGKNNKLARWSQQPSSSDNDNQSEVQERGLVQPTNSTGNDSTIVNTMEEHNDQKSSIEERYIPQEYMDQSEDELTEQQTSSNRPTNDTSETQQARIWSSRHQPTERLREYFSSFPSVQCISEVMQEEDHSFLTGMEDPICFASPQSDTMYYGQAIRAEDSDKFREAMLKEISTHFESRHWEITNLKDLPVSTKLLDSIWAMKRKRRITTGEVYKYKARLNAHGGQQVHCIHYWDTYAPVVMWFAIRMMLSLVLMHNWATLTVDFVLAYPQADVESETYIKLPRGVNFGPNISRTAHALKLLKNIYGLKQCLEQTLTSGFVAIEICAVKMQPMHLLQKEFNHGNLYR